MRYINEGGTTLRRPFEDVAFFIRILIMELQELVERSWAIRQAYHELEVKHHDFKWTVEEDLLALSNDIGNFQ